MAILKLAYDIPRAPSSITDKHTDKDIAAPRDSRATILRNWGDLS